MDTVTIYGIPTDTPNPYPEGFFCGGHEEVVRPDAADDENHYHVSTDATRPPCDRWPWGLG